MAATIKDIAKKLNISTSTVSYALNGGPRPVPEKVRQLVLETAKELHYRPNRLARSLVTRRSYTIGVVPTQASVNLAYTPYFQGCVNGILNEAEQLQQDVLIFTRYDSNRPEDLTDSLLDGRVDGVIFLAPQRGSRIVNMMRGTPLPHVVVSGTELGGTTFRVDNRGGVAAAIRYLHDLGHRRIAHIAGLPELDDAVERQEAYEAAVRELGLAPVVLQGDFTIQGGRAAAENLFSLHPQPTAVFCANDETAAGLIQVARERSIRIPEDLSIVGFDDAPVSGYSFPTITTVRQPWEEMSKEALRALLEIIEEKPAAGRIFPTDLLLKASTTCPPEGNHQ